jgi:hypothetical protein
MTATSSSVSNAADSGECTFALIPLTRGYFARVDLEDFERFGRHKWTATVQRRKDGSLRVYAYRNVRGQDGKYHTIFLHRAIKNATPEQKVDHESRNTLDCRRHNLRWASRRQNVFNRICRPNSLGFIGVYLKGNGYRGRVMIDGRTRYTPAFPTIALAAAARDVLAKQLHGEFAVLNFAEVAA